MIPLPKEAFVLLAFIGAVCALSPIIVTAGETGRQITNTECSDGQSYACRNISTAHDCNMVSDCISDVWVHMKLPEDKSDICALCKEMVKEARDQLLSNETREEIKEVFDGSCNLIPIKPIAKQCREIADKFIPELVETLASEMNPQIICATAGLCNSKWVDTLIKQHYSTAPKTNCEFCHGFVTDIARYFYNSPKSIILEKLLKACNILNSFSTGCKKSSIDHFDELYDYLKTHMNETDDICALGGMCRGIFPTRKLKNGDTTCDFCTTIFQHWVEILTAKTTEEEFKQILHALCEKTGKYEEECNIVVDDYFPEIYEFLVHEFDAKEVCQAFGLCQNGSKYQENVWALLPPGSEEKVKEIIAEEVIGRDEINSLRRFSSVHQPKTNSIPIVASSFKDKVKPNKIEGTKIQPPKATSAIKVQHKYYAELTPSFPEKSEFDKLDVNVDKLPKQDEPELHRVPIYRKNHIKPVVQHLDAASSQLPLERLNLRVNQYNPKKVSCVLCQYTLHYIQNYLSEHSTQEEIKEAVENVCSRMPKEVSEPCQEFVQQYGDYIIILLVQEIDPSQVCPLLKICPAKKENLGQRPNLACDACQFAIAEVDKYLEDKPTQRAIRHTLEEVCGYLPDSFSATCKQIVDEYEQMVVEAIEAGLDSEEVCVYLKFCKPELQDDIMEHDSPTNNAWKKTQVESNMIDEGKSSEEESSEEKIADTKWQSLGVKQPGLSSVGCVICEYAISELEEILKDKETDEEIIEAVENICHILPKTVKKECKDFIDTYGQTIIDLLINKGKDPKEICTLMGLCTSSHSHVHALKLDKCDTCKMVVSYLDKLLVDDEVEEDIEKYLKKVCKLVPPSYKKQCKKIIHVYGPYLFGLIGEFADSNKVCSAVSLCKKPDKQENLLGGDKCTWGPSYWCISPFHAKSCQATEHCKKNVWNRKL